MTKLLTKAEYQRLHVHLGRLLPPGGQPLSPAEVVEVGELQSKLREIIGSTVVEAQRGKKILEWRIPNALAPTMNAWGFMKSWQKANIRKELDRQLTAIIQQTPGALAYGADVRRWVRVTRFTVAVGNIDEAAIDSVGGKMPVDCLVRSGVLVGDTPAYVRREGLVRKTVRGNTHVLIEVYSVGTVEVPDDGPVDAPVTQVVKKKGKLTQAIEGDAATLAKPKPGSMRKAVQPPHTCPVGRPGFYEDCAGCVADMAVSSSKKDRRRVSPKLV